MAEEEAITRDLHLLVRFPAFASNPYTVVVLLEFYGLPGAELGVRFEQSGTIG